MKPKNIATIGEELAIAWDDGHESYFKFEYLRQACPCAVCRGETDVRGHLHKPVPRPMTPQSFDLAQITPVGGYAIQPLWKDGHGSGIYSYEYLRQICPCEECQRKS